MLSRESADDAVRGLDRTDFKKKNISVNYSVKKGMTIGGAARAEPGAFGRMGAKSMAPRLRAGRDESEATRQQQQQRPRFFPDSAFSDGIMDPLAALQRQVNSQYLSTRAGLSAPFSSGTANLGSFNLDAVFPRDLCGRYQPLGLSRSPDRRDVDACFPADDRSRFANFIGAAAAGGNSPQKRGRSPPMRGVRFSPSPKRNMADDRLGVEWMNECDLWNYKREAKPLPKAA